MFDVPVRRSRENVAMKGHRDYVGEEADVYEKNLQFLEKVRDGYINAAKKFENAVKIDCMKPDGTMRSIESISDQVFEYVMNRVK